MNYKNMILDLINEIRNVSNARLRLAKLNTIIELLKEVKDAIVVEDKISIVLSEKNELRDNLFRDIEDSYIDIAQTLEMKKDYTKAITEVNRLFDNLWKYLKITANYSSIEVVPWENNRCVIFKGKDIIFLDSEKCEFDIIKHATVLPDDIYNTISTLINKYYTEDKFTRVFSQIIFYLWD